MPDKYICDCGYSSDTYAENCPMCGALLMSIDGDYDDLEGATPAEKYDEDNEDEEMPVVPRRKAA